MKVKRILRFYFSADCLERTISGLINRHAYGGGSCLEIAERICALIEEKNELSHLWNYIDGIMKGLTGEDIASLKYYALMRCRLNKQPPDIFKCIKRAAVKFRRHARRLGYFGRGIELVNYYYCLLGRSAVGSEVAGFSAGEI